MATDTARIKLELASGRNEVTAPFHQTAQRRRQQLEQDAASVDALAESPARVVVPIPLDARSDEAPALQRPAAEQHAGIPRPPWFVFIGALIAVAVVVWWVMSQRMPEIDPRVVIDRNLHDAQTAMAEGRYTDPPERSAFNYYNTVLALDPSNADALAGIDAIAERQLTHARVLLAARQIPEAGVALEKARRVRPDHNGLAAVEALWRDELRKMTAESKVVDAAVIEAAPTIETPPPPRVPVPVLEIEEETGAPVRVADVSAAAAALADEFAASSVQNQPVVTAPAQIATAVQPKLLKMVQPQYPQDALMHGIEGWVEVSLQVSPAGDVIDPRIENSSRSRIFNRAALAAVAQWKYEPRSDGTTSDRLLVRLQFRAK